MSCCGYRRSSPVAAVKYAALRLASLGPVGLR